MAVKEKSLIWYSTSTTLLVLGNTVIQSFLIQRKDWIFRQMVPCEEKHLIFLRHLPRILRFNLAGFLTKTPTKWEYSLQDFKLHKRSVYVARRRWGYTAICTTALNWCFWGSGFVGCKANSRKSPSRNVPLLEEVGRFYLISVCVFESKIVCLKFGLSNLCGGVLSYWILSYWGGSPLWLSI